MTCRYVEPGDACKDYRDISLSNGATESNNMSIRGLAESLRRIEKEQRSPQDR